METDLLSAEEINRVKACLAQMEAAPEVAVTHTEAKFLCGLVTRVANQAKMTNDQCMRTIKLLRLILKDVL